MLLNWRAELVHEAGETLSDLNEGNLQQPDMADRASLETDHQLVLRTRDRERKLISKIDSPLIESRMVATVLSGNRRTNKFERD